MKLYYKEDMIDSFGIEGYRYWGSNETFTNGTYNAAHNCYLIGENDSPTGNLLKKLSSLMIALIFK